LIERSISRIHQLLKIRNGQVKLTTALVETIRRSAECCYCVVVGNLRRGVTFAEFRERLGTNIEWHGGGKPKKALGWRTAAEYRRDLGYGYMLAA
jgi:hypothetical protein